MYLSGQFRRSMMRSLSILFLLSLLTFSSCRDPQPGQADKLPSISYAPYITAFSSGLVSSRSAIRIELANVVEGVAAGESEDRPLLTITPRVEGDLRWDQRSVLAFHPTEPFRQNQTYTAILDLQTLRPDVPDSLARFSFTFQVIPLGLALDEVQVRPNPLNNDPRQRQITGVVRSYDYAESPAIEQTLIATQNGEQLPIAWTHVEQGRRHAFVVDQVQRGEEASKVTLRLRGDALQVRLDTLTTVQVPSVNTFTLTGLEVEQSAEQVVSLYFSDPLDADLDLTGLVHLADGTDMRLVRQNNAILAYPLARRTGNIELIIERSIQSTSGAKLDSTLRRTVTFTDLKPAIELTGEGVIVPSSQGATFPFRAVALNSVEVEVVKVFTNNIAQFLSDNQLSEWSRLTRVGRPVYRGRVPLRGNQAIDYLAWNHFAVDLSELIEVEPGAIYHVTLSYGPGNSQYPCDELLSEPIASTSARAEFVEFNTLSYWSDYDDNYYYRGEGGEDPCSREYYNGRKVSRNFMASDIGLLAKRADAGELFIVASELTSTEPISGLTIDLLNIQQQVIASAKTAPNGVAIFRPEYQPFLAVARRNSERAYLRLDDGSSLNSSTFDVSGERIESGTRGMIYGERGVWRPGDSIYLTLILERSAEEARANAPVIFELYNPSGQLVEERAVVASAPQMYSLHTATAADAPTGPWRAVVRAGGTRISETIRVESVMPNRLKVELDFAGDPVPLHRDASATLSARWLFGAASGALKADVNYSAGPLSNTSKLPGFERYEDYSFRDGSRSFSVSDQTIFDGKLSQAGTATLDFGIEETSTLPGLLQARITTRVFETTGAFSTVVESAVLSPFASYVGIKAPEAESYYGLDASKPQPFELVVLDEQGRLVGRDELKVEIYDIDWSYWWERDGGNSLANYVANKASYIALETEVSAPTGKATYRAQLSKLSYGRKLIRVVDPVSGHATSTTFYLEDPRWAYDPSTRPGGAELLTFNLDDDAYAPGDEIRVALPAFPGGRAFVSVETGDGIQSYRWVEGRDTPQEVLIAAEADMAPNAYVAVSLIQPHAQTANDQPIRLYGIQPFKLTDPARQLAPKLSLPAELAPEESFTVKVSEANGRAMSYTLAIVEEGLLDITSFKTPDPFERFNRRVALGVRTWDLYEHVLGAFAGKLAGLLAIGGDEDTGKKADPRANRFRPVVKHIGPFRLAAGATATHSIDMPNYIGSVRAMVVAAAEDAYGSTEETRPVKRPLMVLATLPRVLGPGETVDLPITVFALDEKIGAVNIKVEGLELLQANTTSTRVSFAEPGEQTARLQLRVPEQLGVARVRVVATAAGFSASDEIEIQVRAPNPEVSVVQAAVVEPGETWTSAYLAAGMAGTNSGLVEVSANLPLNLEDRLGYLTRYPHGCLEQTVSGAFPQLYLSDLVTLDEVRAGTVQRNVNAALRRLLEFEYGSGRFTFWPGARSDYASWASAYAGHFMVEAEAKGYRLPAGLLNRWKAAEKVAANAWTPQRTQVYAYEIPATQAYRLYALALAESPQLGAMNRLRGYDKLDAVTSNLLAAAYLVAGQRDIARELVASASSKDNNDATYFRYSYGSATRDEGIALYVQTQLGQRDKAFKLAQSISRTLSSDRWLSTQATSWSLLAMARYIADNGAANQALNYTLGLAGAAQDVTQAENVRVMRLATPAPEERQFKFVNTGERRAYVRVVTTGTPSTSQQKAEQSHLKMSVVYTDLSGQVLDIASLKQGQDFIATTRITHPGMLAPYNEMAYTQIFPSGWEIRNERLEGADTPTGLDYQDIRDDRVLSYFDLNTNETLTIVTQLNAAYTGSYYLPDRYCQAMYDRDIRARIPGEWVQVE